MPNVADSSSNSSAVSLAPEGIDAWRRNIRTDTFANYHISMGIRLLCLREATAAADHLRRALALLPTAAEPRYLLVRALETSSQYNEADRLHRESLALLPDFEIQGLEAALDRLIGLQHAQDGVFLVEAAALELRESALIQKRLAHLHCMLGQAEAAKLALEKAMRLGVPNLECEVIRQEITQLYVKAGLSHLLAGKQDEAAAQLRQAVAMEPENAEANYLLLYALMASGQDAEAGQLRTDRGLSSDFEAHGLCNALDRLIAQAQFSRGIGLLQSAGHPLQECGNVQCQAARLYLGMSQLEAATEALVGAARREAAPDRMMPTFQNVLAQIRTKWPLSRVASFVRSFVHQAPNEPAAHLALGRVLMLLDRLEEAGGVFNQARRLAADLPDSHFSCGLVHLALGQLDDAANDFEAASCLYDRPEAWMTWIGLVRHAQGRLNEAEALHRRTIDSGSDDEGYGVSNLGLVYMARGDLAAAQAAQAAALTKAQPVVGWIKSNLALVKTRLGRSDEAAKLFMDAYNWQPDAAHFHARLRPWLTDEIRAAYPKQGGTAAGTSGA